jgi:hypothetical protein
LSGVSLVVVVNSIAANGWKQSLIYLGINALLIVVQLIGIAAYFSIKHKRFTNIINTYLGSGDLWFYGIVACSFSPMNFVVFNITACFIILLVFAVTGIKSLQEKTIPLAGCLAIGLVVVILSSRIFHFINPYDDYFMFRSFVKL